MQYKQAHEIAIRCYKEIALYCKHAEIAGSIRREKPEVKDIELVVVPKVTEEKDLFGEVLGFKRSSSFCKAVRSLGLILKGDVENGRYVQIYLPEKINLDLFIPQEHDWVRQYVIRTGSSEYSHNVIANGWLKKGWAGTKEGLRLQSECYQKLVGAYPDGREKKEWVCNTQDPTLPPIFETEYDFYQWLNLTWISPDKRK